MSSAIYVVNNYLWKLLQEKGGYDAADYGGMTPIIPGSQEPEFENFTAPYLVYGYTKDSTDPSAYVVRRETAVYTIYATTAKAVNDTIELITNALGRVDDSAADVNHWVVNPANPKSAEYEGMLFNWFMIGATQGNIPADSEGGRESGYITIRYCYGIGTEEGEYRF